ncbi:MAG: SGNH/GDSL hydrolase family protein [Magnetospirillum sp.]|nr:SGNH/GDSL hydrolase family protein [Magnetospirillum sp.]
MPSPPISRLFHWTVATLLVVAMIELAFRLVIFPGWRDLHHDMYVPHPAFGHYTKPNLDIRRLNPGNWDVRLHTNALGMRGRNADMAAELAGLWVLGDSNTFGGYVGDGEVFTARLAGFGLRSANLASEGHSLAYQARVLRWLAAQGKRPRAVLAVVTIYHGIRPYEGAEAELQHPAAMAAQPADAPHAAETLRAGLSELAGGLPTSALAVRTFLGTNSAVYGWLKSGIMGIPALRALSLTAGLRTDLDLVYPFSLDLLRPMTEGNPALAEVRATAALLAGLADFTRRELGLPFGVLVLPGNHQLYPAAFAKWRTANALGGEDLDPLRALRALEAEVAARGVPALDVLAPLQASPVRVIFPDDGHLNAEGHRIVAEAVAAWLPGALGLERRP